MTRKLLTMTPLKDLVDNVDAIVRVVEATTGRKATPEEITALRVKIEKRAIADSEKARKH
jgi:hypothetical protein